jgi:outer membrane protein
MKIVRHLVLVAAVLTAAILSTNAAETKLATVDMKKLFNGYYKTKLAQSALDNRKLELRKEIKDMADSIEKAQGQYKQLLDQSSDPSLSAEEREKRKQTAAEKAKEINKQRGDIEQFQRQAEAQIADQSQRMSVNVVTEIQKAVSDKAKAGGYTIVLNSASVESVIYAGPENDLTSAVLAQLNAGAPIDVAAPAAATLPLNISTNLP